MKTLLFILALFALAYATIDPETATYIHNYYRVSNNLHRPNGTKLELPELRWSEKRAKEAHMQASEVQFYYTRFPKTPLGEEANSMGYLTYCGPETDLSVILHSWFTNGREAFQYGKYPKVYKTGFTRRDAAPYAQLVNEYTREVGCAQTSKCTTCRYYPAGNMEPWAPYT